MCTSIQKKLLVLLKEIDELCRKNDIEYYLTGGCLIGAVRNGSFLAWDDDADIHMTRDNAMKFLALEDEKKLPENRLLYRGELESGTAPVHWRYEACDSTFTGKYSVLFGTPAGIFVDIFILDPLKCDDDSAREIKKQFQLFLQYRDRYTTHGSFPDAELVKDYNILKEREKKEGFEKIKKEFEDRFWRGDEETADHYIMRSPGAYVVPKRFLGKAVRMEFEDTSFAVPEDARSFLDHIYGSRWMDVPLITERTGHPAVKDTEIPYRLYNEEAEVITRNSSEIKKTFSGIKSCFYKMYSCQRGVQKKQLDILGCILVKKIKKRLSEEKKDFKDIIKSCDISGLEDLFSDYYELQFSEGIKWDIYIEIPPEYLYGAVLPLLYRGDFEKTDDLLEGYMDYDDRYKTAKIRELKEFSSALKEMNALVYVKNDMKEARLLAEKYIKKWNWTVSMARLDALLLVDEEKVAGGLCERIYSYVEHFPRDGELLSYYGDALYISGDIKRSLFFYKKALSNLRNGIVASHIRDRIKSLNGTG